jgi:hypothetical protein
MIDAGTVMAMHAELTREEIAETDDGHALQLEALSLVRRAVVEVDDATSEGMM